MPATSANPPIPSLTALHPTLRDHWTNFDGDLNTQLTSAQRDEYYIDADTHMTSSEEFRAPDVPRQKQKQAPQIEQHRLHPLVIPTSGFQSTAPYTDTSSAASTHGSSQKAAQYPSALPQAPPHRHQPTHQHHHYQSDVPQSASSQNSSQEYKYHATDPRYDPYAQPTYQHQHQHQHRPQDQDQQYYQTRQYHHHHHTDPSHQYTTTASSLYTLPMSHYQDSSAQAHHWDDVRGTYPEPVSRSQPLTQYSQYDDYDYTVTDAHESIAEEPQQLHLQETWQSFGVYVGSPRPMP